jgi:hypothetical protein
LLWLAASITFQVMALGVHWQCEFHEHHMGDGDMSEAAKAMMHNHNGWYLPASGTLSVLIVFCEAGNQSPSANWPVGQLPLWANQLLDVAPSGNPQGLLTKYFYEASLGQLNVVGDYLVSQQNGGIFTFNSLPSGPTSGFI